MALLVRQHGAISLHPKSIILAVALIFLLGTLVIVYWKPRAGKCASCSIVEPLKGHFSLSVFDAIL